MGRPPSESDELSPGIGAQGVLPAGRMIPHNLLRETLFLKKRWDPRSDWDLESLNRELDSLHPFTQTLHSPPPSSRSFNAKGVVEVVQFQKGGFRMSLVDDSSDDEDLEASSQLAEQTKGELPREVASMKKSPPSKTLPGVDENMRQKFLITGTTAAEAALHEMERKHKALAQDKLRQRREDLRAKFELARQEEAAALHRLQLKESENALRLHDVDMRDLRAVAELRDLHLAKVQRDHEQRTQVEKRLLRDMAAAEEARSAKARAEKEARERAEAEAKKEADRKAAEAKRQAEERERREKEERSKAEQRAKLEAEAKAKAKDAAKAQAQAAAARAASPSAAAGLMTTGVAPAAQVPPTIPQGEGGGPSTAPRLKISERAAETERILKVKLVEMRAQSQPFEADESRKKERKMLERKLILHVQQVSATQQQVRRKSMELVELLQDPRQPKPFLILTFAAKLLSQCEVQVQKLPQFAFALAQVTVNVAMQVPLVMDILLAELHRVCIYTVPKHYVFTQNTLNSDEEYYSLLGYRMEDGKLETTDSYVGRMVGYVTFYAAITQTDVVGGQHPHGLANAWTWCAALLRRLPPNRATASVLEAFLKVAGFRLYQSYRKPFEKLLTSVLHEFVGALRDQNNADTRAAVSRIETYANTRRFLQPPEGRDMPVSDDSSRYRA